MPFAGGDVEVKAGTGVRNGDEKNPFMPLVRMRVTDTSGKSVELTLVPKQARQIGMDLLSAAVMSWADTGVRTFARQSGVDGETIIGMVEELVKLGLADEEV